MTAVADSPDRLDPLSWYGWRPWRSAPVGPCSHTYAARPSV